jgi:hypothetical protein
MSTSVIEFSCWENDEPIEVQLEPEAIIFIVSQGNSLRFVGTNSYNDFKWALRVDHKDKGIQLFPESSGIYKIEIFENDELVEDWYKYMK